MSRVKYCQLDSHQPLVKTTKTEKLMVNAGWEKENSVLLSLRRSRETCSVVTMLNVT